MRQRAMLPGLFLLAAAAALLVSCRSEECDVDAIAECYRQQIAQMPPPPDRRLTRPPVGAASQPVSTQLETGLEPRLPRDGIVQLSLSDTIRRALCNSLDIRIESYSPGIAAMDIVIAEAKFDTVFFVNPQFAHTDQGNNLAGINGTGQTDSRSVQTGFRKQLITGGQIAVTYQANRVFQDQTGLRFNPSYDTAAALELRQPLLQGFGVDVNKAEIHISTNQRDISMQQFRLKVMQSLADVEEAYWNLYLARESLGIGQELLARTERIYEMVIARSLWDAMPVQIAQVASAVASRRAVVVRLVADVRTAEDRLKNLLNDPSLPLNEDIALLPTTPPLTQTVELDPQRELWIGLEYRPEPQQARLAIANANIQLDVARSLQLPKLDLVAQWALNGLKGDLGNSTEQLLAGRLQDYIFGFEFQVPIGNRGPNALVRQDKLKIDQAIAVFHRAVADVMTQIQIALREVQTTHREIVANRQAVEASTATLEALIARRVGLTPDYLDLELRSQETQAETRRALVGAIANYNIAIVRLEQAKGTLLDYDRVQLEPGR